MITPSPMELLSFVVLRQDAQEVASRLVKLALFHPVDIRSIEEKIRGLSQTQIDREKAQLESLDTRIRDLARKLKVGTQLSCDRTAQSFSYDQLEAKIVALQAALDPLVSQRESAQADLATNRAMLVQVRDYAPLPAARSPFYSFLDVSTGRVEEKNIQLLERSLEHIPHVVYPFRKENGRYLLTLLIGLRRDRALLEKVRRDIGWQDIEYTQESDQLSREAQQKIAAAIQQQEHAIRQLDQDIRLLRDEHAADLNAILSFVALKQSLLEAQRYACTTEKTVLFSGWVPREERERVVRMVRDISASAYVEARSPEGLGVAKDQIPVRMHHTALVKPFEILIGAYGMPRYGTIDPTIFVAISFLLMFGAMFGDLGHGLTLMAASLFLLRKRLKDGVRQAGALLLYCGISSSIFGFLYGSFFGFEFESVWIKPMQDIMGVFKASIFFGIGLISLGIALNIINALRDRDYTKALFDKAGLIGGVIYWAAIGVVSKYFFSRAPVPPVYAFLILTGLAILFVYPVLDCLMRKRYSHCLESLMESTINIMEIFMGYLANTVSFIRVAAFALAHAGLFIAIFTLSRVAGAEGGYKDLVAWIIIVVGNIFVVFLEGLVVSIQSVRLNYYEFFSKFFVSGKQAYKPLAL